MKLLQMLSKRVTRTLITFRRKIKINATENATVPTPSFEAARSHLAAPTSSCSCLQRSRLGRVLIRRSRCIEARSAHNLRASLAIGVCAKSMLRERRCSL